jgi:hypothetical protein
MPKPCSFRAIGGQAGGVLAPQSLKRKAAVDIKTKDGVTLSASGTYAPGKGVNGAIVGKLKGSLLGVRLDKMEVTTGQRVTGCFSLANLWDGLKLSFTAVHDMSERDEPASSGKLDASYKNKWLQVDGSLDCVRHPTLKTAAVAAFDIESAAVHVGAEAVMDTKEESRARVKDLSAAVGVGVGDYTFALRSAKKFSQVKASAYTKLSPMVQSAVELTYDRTAKRRSEAFGLAAGISRKISGGCKVQAQIDSAGLLHAAIGMEMNPFMTTSLGMKIDTRSLGKDEKHAFGFTLGFRA